MTPRISVVATIIAVSSLLSVCRTRAAEEFPIKLGTGSDSVFLQTGVDPDLDKRNSLHPDLNALLSYDADMKVREITLGLNFFADLGAANPEHPRPAPPSYALHGVAIGDAKAGVLAKLGNPARAVPRSEMAAQIPEVETFVWKPTDKLLLLVSFYRKDSAQEPRTAKDTVASVTLRRANF